MLLLIDENRFRGSFSLLPEFKRRLGERRKAWEELTSPLGIQIAYFNSEDSESSGEVIERAGQLVWSNNAA